MKTYVFRLKDKPDGIVAAFTISNDSIRIKQLAPEDKAKIEYVTENGEKNLRRYPGVLVGRLGTSANVNAKWRRLCVITVILLKRLLQYPAFPWKKLPNCSS